jgi:hypothetical protein
MSEQPDEALKRAFARAPVVGADEGFVAALASDVAARRRAQRLRRVGLMALLGVVGVGLAWWLAPLALTASVSSLGNTLLGLPDQLGATAQQVSRVPAALFLGLALIAVALPLAAAAWLARRV